MTLEIPRLDLRQRRVQVLVAEILSIVTPHLCDHRERDPREDVYHALMEAFLAKGVEILTDYDRQVAGLPPRGPDGWTLEEIVQLEKLRLEALTKPLQIFIPATELAAEQQLDLLKRPGNVVAIREKKPD